MSIRYSPSTRGFYHPDQAAPADAVAVEDEHYAALFQAQCAGAEIGLDATGALVAVMPPPPTLAQVQEACRDEVDAQAETQRLRFITGGAGQAMVYLQKQAQAVSAATDASPTAAKYPLLAVEVGITLDPQSGAPAADVVGVARAVAATVQAWLPIAAAIEGARLKGKAAVAAATTVDAARAALAAVAWPTA